VEFLQAQVNANAFKSLIVDPFDNKNRNGDFATAEDKQQLSTMMEATGSVAARRAHRSFKSAGTIVIATNRMANTGRSADSYMSERQAQRDVADTSGGRGGKGKDDRRKTSSERKQRSDQGEGGVRKSIKHKKGYPKRQTLNRGQSERVHRQSQRNNPTKTSLRRAKSERGKKVVPS
jgi:hypothetical protein